MGCGSATTQLTCWARSPALPVHVTVEKTPSVLHVASPLPLYPASQVTVTACPVVPVIESSAALSELATLVAVHALATNNTSQHRVCPWLLLQQLRDWVMVFASALE